MIGYLLENYPVSENALKKYLNVAQANWHANTVHEIIKRNVNLGLNGEVIKEFFLQALSKEKDSVVDYLLSNKIDNFNVANVNFTDHKQIQFLVNRAIQLHSLSIVEKFILQCPDKMNLLYKAIAVNHTETLQFVLIQLKKDNFFHNSHNLKLLKEILFNAIENNEIQHIRILIKEYPELIKAFNFEGNTALHIAACLNQHGHDLVQELIKMGGNVETKNLDNGLLPLHYAVQSNLDSVKLLLHESPKSIDSVTSNNESPLIFAARQGKGEIAKFLLENKANVNIMAGNDYEGKYTALDLAIRGNYYKIVKLLIPHDTATNFLPAYLFKAIKNKNIEMATILLDARPDYFRDCVDGYENTLLHCAWEIGNVDLINKLLSLNVPVDKKNFQGITFMELMLTKDANFNKDAINFIKNKNIEGKLFWPYLFNYIKEGNFSEVEKLLQSRPELIDAKDSQGNTLLHAALNFGDYKLINHLINLLVEKGSITSFLKSKDDEKELIPLHIAIYLGNLELVTQLLQYSPDTINEKNKKNQTPLIYAIDRENLEMTAVLIRNGADINVRDINDKSPLDIALNKEDKNYSLIKFLLENGAEAQSTGSILLEALKKRDMELLKIFAKINPHVFSAVVDTEGRTLLHWAAELDDSDTMEKLLSFNPDINAAMNIKNKFGIMPIHIAVHHDVAGVAVLLKNFPNDVNALTHIKETPLMFAAAMGNQRLVDHLLENKADANLTNQEGNTALGLAIIRKQYHIVDELVERNDTEFTIKRDSFFKAIKGNNLRAIKIFINKNPQLLFEKDANGKTPIDLAFAGKNSEVIKFICKECLNKNLNFKENFFESLRDVILNKKEDNFSYFKEMISFIEDFNLKNDNNNLELLELAIKASKEKGGDKFLKCILNSPIRIPLNADIFQLAHEMNLPNAMFKNLWNFNLNSGAKNLNSIVTCLYTNEINIPFSNEERVITPLHVAVENKNMKAVIVLIQNGANINIKNWQGNIPEKIGFGIEMKIATYFNELTKREANKSGIGLFAEKIANVQLSYTKEEKILAILALFKILIEVNSATPPSSPKKVAALIDDLASNKRVCGALLDSKLGKLFKALREKEPYARLFKINDFDNKVNRSIDYKYNG